MYIFTFLPGTNFTNANSQFKNILELTYREIR